MRSLKFKLILSLVGLVSALSFAKSSESEVKDFVARWVEAQNKGDFAAYSQFYGSPFSGIRRSGTRVRMMNRDTWLTDRRAMFKRPMTVTVSKISVVTIGDTILVSFVQDWKSATYHDVGKKAILLSKTEPLKIV